MTRWRCILTGTALILVLSLLPVMAPGVFAQTTYADDMSNPNTGLLSQVSPDPSQYSFQYLNGQFIAQAINPGYQGEIFSMVGTPELFNSTMSVDAGIGGADEREIYIFVGCRSGFDNDGYLFMVVPTTGQATLYREDPTGSVVIAETNALNLMTPGANQFNRIGLDCFDDQITGAVNGTIVITQTDSTYQSGLNYLGIGNLGGASDNLFGVFDNLIVVDHGLPTGSTGGSAALPTPTTAAVVTMPTPTTAAVVTMPTPTTAAVVTMPTPTTAAVVTMPTPTTGATGATSVGAPLTFEQGMAWVQANPPTAGPFSAAADLVDGDSKFLAAGVAVSSFYAEVDFIIPTNPPPGFWAIGLCFWLDPAGNCYSAFIGTDGTTAQWFAVYDPASGSLQTITSGPLSTINLTPGATNTFGLLVSGTTATVTMDGLTAAGTFTIPGQPVTGDIKLNVSFSDDADADTRPLHLETSGFSVWDLAAATGSTGGASTTSGSTAGRGTGTGSSTGTTTGPAGLTPVTLVAGPLTGTISEDVTTVTAIRAGVTLTDFYATATFTVPPDVSTPWDITIAFRENPATSDEYRFTIFSTGEWRLTFGTTAPSIVSGTVTNLAVAPGQTNVLEIYVQGTAGYPRLNGVDLGVLDLSLSQTAGDVWIGTATVDGTTLPGRLTPYSGFEVWSLS